MYVNQSRVLRRIHRTLSLDILMFPEYKRLENTQVMELSKDFTTGAKASKLDDHYTEQF
jgi:hypothetical protein